MIDHVDDLQIIFMLPNNNKNENTENKEYLVDCSHNVNAEKTCEDFCPEVAEPKALISHSYFSDFLRKEI